MLQKSHKFLISRTDKAGDVILTTPIIRELKRLYRASSIVVHVRSYTAPLINMTEADGIIADDRAGRPVNLLKLVKQIKTAGFTHAIIVHPSPRAIMACTLAGIPFRTGRASNICQFLLTHRCVQHRSENIKHEYRYNLDLILALGVQPDYSPPELHLKDEMKSFGRMMLEKAGFQRRKPVVVHPGHGGSAFNLPPENYAEIVSELRKRGIPVAVSLGRDETPLARYFPEPVPDEFALISNIPDLEMLAGVFTHCLAFAGGSTGPMHLAAALGKPVLAFFPALKSMTPTRWGPAGYDCMVIQPMKNTEGVTQKCSESLHIEKEKILTGVSWLYKRICDIQPRAHEI